MEKQNVCVVVVGSGGETSVEKYRGNDHGNGRGKHRVSAETLTENDLSYDGPQALQDLQPRMGLQVPSAS